MIGNLHGNENEAAAFSRSHRKARLRRIPGYGGATRETGARAEAQRRRMWRALGSTWKALEEGERRLSPWRRAGDGQERRPADSEVFFHP